MEMEAKIFILILLVSLVLSIGVSCLIRKRLREGRLLRLTGRKCMDVGMLVDSHFFDLPIDRDLIARELNFISRKISVPAGLLRPNDVLEDLIGVDYFVGDAVLEIERRLQLSGASSLRRLTIRQIIMLIS